jgi:peptidyl-prolyl cis-trans isomerase B (cyclophilin B)
MIDGMNTLVLKQSDNRWSTDTSFPCPIDNPSADSIADAFRSLLVDFFVEENPPEIASYGLDTPTVSVKVKTTNGDELILLIGKAAEGTLEEDPSRELSGWYCKTNLRKTVYVLAEYQRKKLAKTLLDVRDRTVTKNFELDDINEISFVFADKSTSTVVKSDSRWVIDTDDGPSILCDNKYMDHLISGLSGIKAIGIASDYVKELYKVKLDVPDLVLSLHNSLTNEVLSLAIKWDAKGNLYIHNQKGPTSYVVNGELISLFPEKRADLFNRFPLRNVRPEYVKAVSIEAVAMESIVMERKIIPDKDSSWNLISPVKFNLDERQVAQWLVRLRSVPVSSFLQEGKSGLKQYGLSSPLAKADITFQESLEEKSEQISVYVGSETENKLFHYCMISSMNAVFTIRKSIARLFLAPSITYSTNAQNNINPDKNVLANDTADPSLYRPLESEEKTLPRALIQTSLGSISLILFEDEAPNHVANFIHLSENNFYRDTTFHRVENFCIQGGDPNTKDDDKTNDGKGDPGYSINDEINEKRKNRKYYLSMAHKGPNTGGCQFFILKEDAPWLDGIHTVFGAVTDGGDVVDSILPGTIIEDIHILNKRAHDYVPRKNTF